MTPIGLWLLQIILISLWDGEGFSLPINEMGEECPYPLDPAQWIGVPVALGQYHCPYCGGMVIAGVPHLRWNDTQFVSV